MFFKLSFRNAKKSFKNYMLYFFTLSFAVCIFYVFNSVGAQEAMLTLSESGLSTLHSLVQLIGMISVFVSFVLGFLIVFANSFMIRRRKKELGLYLILGMTRRKISMMFIAETFFIGLISLATGLASGVFISQWLSIVTAKLFDADMTQFVFVFSSDAFVKTLMYFSIIFVVAMLFAMFTVSKHKLIDLVYAEKHNEKPTVRSIPMTVFLFVLSIAFLLTAYVMVIRNGLFSLDRTLAIEIILGSIGTFLFFASLSGFFLRLIQTNKKRYYSKLNMFILRQVNSRINTAFISMSFICLMLFFTICILSAGLSINTIISNSIENSTPFDVTILNYDGVSIENYLEDNGIILNDYSDQYHEYKEYALDELTNAIILEPIKQFIPENDSKMFFQFRDDRLSLIKESDYNTMLRTLGKDEILLNENSVAVYSDYAIESESLRYILQKFIDTEDSVVLQGRTYNIYPELLTQSIAMTRGEEILVLIVPDDLLINAQPKLSIMSFNCTGDSETTQIRFKDDIEAMLAGDFNGYVNIKYDIVVSYTGTKAIISYIGIYLGIIFLITSAAVLGLQQLSEVADNRVRYTILKKIGVGSSMLNGSVFKQIAIYFSLPLSLACVHSVVGLYVLNKEINTIGDVNIASNIIVTGAMILLVYGLYFFATYIGSKNMISKSEMR